MTLSALLKGCTAIASDVLRFRLCPSNIQPRLNHWIPPRFSCGVPYFGDPVNTTEIDRSMERQVLPLAPDIAYLPFLNLALR
jgi:hypothetical protein